MKKLLTIIIVAGFLLIAIPKADAAIAYTHLDSGSVSGPPFMTGVFTTNSVSPGNNDLVLLTIDGNGSLSAPSSVVYNGTGLTFTLATSTAFGSGPTATGLFIYRALGSSVTSGTITVTWSSGMPIAATYSLIEFSGVITTGTNGSGAIIQTTSTTTPPTAFMETSLTGTLPSGITSGDTTYGAFVTSTGNGLTGSSGYTSADTINAYNQFIGQYNLTGTQSQTVTFTGNPPTTSGLLLEIGASGGGGGGTVAYKFPAYYLGQF